MVKTYKKTKLHKELARKALRITVRLGEKLKPKDIEKLIEMEFRKVIKWERR